MVRVQVLDSTVSLDLHKGRKIMCKFAFAKGSGEIFRDEALEFLENCDVSSEQ